jgi:quinol monooxygenase YgiN
LCSYLQWRWRCNTSHAAAGKRRSAQVTSDSSNIDQAQVHTQLSLILPEERREEGLAVLRWLVSQTRAQPGCLSCHALQQVDSSAVFFLEEVWASKSDLERYVASDDYRRVLSLMEMSAETPTFHCYVLAQSFGLEEVVAAREPARRGPAVSLCRLEEPWQRYW